MQLFFIYKILPIFKNDKAGKHDIGISPVLFMMFP